MTTHHDDLKTRVFEVANELHALYSSYEGLSVLSVSACADSENVGVVIVGLNYRFQALLVDLDKLYQRDF